LIRRPDPQIPIHGEGRVGQCLYQGEQLGALAPLEIPEAAAADAMAGCILIVPGRRDPSDFSQAPGTYMSHYVDS
jgi:hypothetical protein